MMNFEHLRLSWFTPWPRRRRQDLLKKTFVYNPSGVYRESFTCLLDESDKIQPNYTSPTRSLSVVIPAMNEKERLPVMLNECLSYLMERYEKDSSFTFEVIVVDDGSSDGTCDVAFEYSKKYGDDVVKVLKLDKNRGKGGAVRCGVMCSRGAMILFADADGATKFSDFEKLEEQLLHISSADELKNVNSFDWTQPIISVGSRAYMEAESIATRSIARTILMVGFHLLVYVFTVRTIHDTQCGFKLFSRAAAAKLFPAIHIERWAFDVELLYLAEHFGYRISEVAVRWHEVDGSKIVPIWSWIQMGRDLLLIWFSGTIGIECALKCKEMSSKKSTKASKQRTQKQSTTPQENDAENVLVMHTERVLNVYDTDSDFALGHVEGWDVERYIRPIKIVIVNESEDGMTLEFDLIHVEAPIANAIRRVLIAEVPTMAFEKIYLYQNTSVIQDEVLCHRLGLLPIRADPRLFEMPLTKVIGINESGVDCDEEPPGDPTRNLIFELKVSCQRKSNAPKTATDPREIFENACVYSNAFEWIPIGDQAKSLPYHPAMVHDDILIAKLRPRQEIEARCHCVKGIGRDHAKFSPVATASYRLLPIIKLKKKFSGNEAELIKASFSDGVIDIDSDGCAYVKDARRDTCSRNIQRHEELAEHIELARRKDHFICEWCCLSLLCTSQ
ncbi:unnamed protein product [Anisakis simplex]|uniref:DNA-directed RNA polymerases I and III subunit RPAC1 n=1 Tax=Anisakis simplex TaxID=6269 RepID=A0A0M3JXN2_ANISI|nr:unnamed protein product [Anisakis simplex]